MCLSHTSKMVEAFVSTAKFSKIFRGVNITKATPELLQFSMKVTEDKCNELNSLHGGFTSSMVDFISTVDLMRLGHPAGVSVDLSVQYMNAAMLDTSVLFNSRLMKVGKKLAFCEVDLVDELSQKILARGKHVKYLNR